MSAVSAAQLSADCPTVAPTHREPLFRPFNATFVATFNTTLVSTFNETVHPTFNEICIISLLSNYKTGCPFIISS